MVVLSFYGTFLEREFGIYSKFGLGTFRNLRINIFCSFEPDKSELKLGNFKGKRSLKWRICITFFDSSVVFIKSEENLWILLRKSVETCWKMTKI